MIFRELLKSAKNGDVKAVTALLMMYKPLLVRESIVDGVFDEDLYQELCLVFLRCIDLFNL